MRNHRADRFETMQDGLVSKYGTPDFEVDTSEVVWLSWDDGHVSLDYQFQLKSWEGEGSSSVQVPKPWISVGVSDDEANRAIQAEAATPEKFKQAFQSNHPQ